MRGLQPILENNINQFVLLPFREIVVFGVQFQDIKAPLPSPKNLIYYPFSFQLSLTTSSLQSQVFISTFLLLLLQDEVHPCIGRSRFGSLRKCRRNRKLYPRP